MASPIPPSQPIPLERSIRWVPAGSRTETDGYAEYRSIVIPSGREESSPPSRDSSVASLPRNDTLIEDHAIFISQDALREIGDHARTSAGDDVLGFLLGERYECPDSGTHYAVITTVVRTGHVIAESDVVQIPDEEWLGIQLEVRRRHLTLIGWYHTAPFVALNPSRWDLDTQRARFTEPWQCGLVIATGGRAAGGFFRTTRGPSSAQSGPGDVLGGTQSGAFVPFYELLDDASLPAAGGAPRTLIDWRNYVTDIDVDRDALRESFASSPGEPTPSGPTTPVLLPTGWDGDETSALPPRRPRRSRARWAAFLALIVVAAVTVWSLRARRGADLFSRSASRASDSGRIRTPAGTTPRTSTSASGDVGGAPHRAPGTATRQGASPSSPSPTAPAASASSSSAAPAPLTNPSLIRFNRLADSLQQATVNYHTRRADFDLHRIDCTGLARGYRAADDALVALAALYRDVHGLLSPAQIARYENLGASLDTVNGDFEGTGCPRP